MKVLVVYQIAENGTDLRIRMVNLSTGRVSRVVTLEGKAHTCAGNPYGVYGSLCEAFAGRGRYTLTINVARLTSGDL